MIPHFAQSASGELSNSAIIGIVVVGLSALASLAVALITLSRLTSGKANERQIEPTQLAALQAELRQNFAANQTELRAQTVTLQKLDRESEGARVSIENVKTELSRLRDDVKAESDNQFKRINAISAESTATKTRVEILERRK